MAEDDPAGWTHLYGFGQFMSHRARANSVRVVGGRAGRLEAGDRVRVEVRFEALSDLRGVSAWLWIDGPGGRTASPMEGQARAGKDGDLLLFHAEVTLRRGWLHVGASLHGGAGDEGYPWPRAAPEMPERAWCWINAWSIAVGPTGRAQARLAGAATWARRQARSTAYRASFLRPRPAMRPRPVPPGPPTTKGEPAKKEEEARAGADPGIDLVFIHTNKVAGTSFNTFLKATYGTAACLRILHGHDGRYHGDPIDLAMVRRLRPEARVVHGHFTYRDAEPLVAATGARVVTWLREPVSRVLSHYIFSQRVKARISRQEGRLVELEPLEDLIHRPFFLERMSLFLRGADLGSLYFVGIQEHFADDLRSFAALLGTTAQEIPRAADNDSRRFRDNLPPVDERIRRRVARLNRRDGRLYRKALRLRGRRAGTGGADDGGRLQAARRP